MTRSDDAILELLDDAGIAVPPTAIAFNIENVSQPTVDRRLPKLEKAGLVKRYEEPQGYTEITEKGQRYLRGEISASDLPDLED